MPQTGGKNAKKKSSSSTKRHFTVVIGNKEHGLYVSSSPSSAARKAVSKLCATDKKKKVQFQIREITQGSKKKTYGPYLGEIEKLAKPIELKGRVIKYKPVAKLSSKSGAKKGGMRGGATLWINGSKYIFTNKKDEWYIFKNGRQNYITFIIKFNDLLGAPDIFNHLGLCAAFEYVTRSEFQSSNFLVSANSANRSNKQKRQQEVIDKVTGYLLGLTTGLSGRINLVGETIYIYIQKKEGDLLKNMHSIQLFKKKSDTLYVYNFDAEEKEMLILNEAEKNIRKERKEREDSEAAYKEREAAYKEREAALRKN